MIDVLSVLSLLSSGLVHKVDGTIRGIAIACMAHCFALDAQSDALILAAVLMANSKRDVASCDAPFLSTVTTSPTRRCDCTTGGENPSKHQLARISRSLLVHADSVIFSGCVMWPAKAS